MDASPRHLLVPAAVLALGIALGGLFLGLGFRAGRSADRYVTVKGAVEREVEANLAVWPLQLVTAADLLPEAQAEARRRVELTRAFLAENGIVPEQITVQGFRVVDAEANPYQSGQVSNRYVITQTLMVRSEDPKAVLAASQRIGDLVDAGVVLISGEEYGPGGPTFLFTRLNDLKPAMLAEATSRAREAADQFASSSGSSVGGIRRANQGVFEILPRDPVPGQGEQNQLFKTVRVVATFEYVLEG
ncbi:MAG TPA: SIMPL domain-containing protein [Longimicrobiales bacterium]|nr:SIMPL domain-containing protein [Longimicrobiales bacterium]